MADPPNVPHSAQRQIDQNTKEILEKIAEINKKQGLIQKKPKPSYFHFPFSYSRSQQPKESQFKFSRDPFSNPILDYLEKEGSSVSINENPAIPTFRRPNLKGSEDVGFSITDTNAQVLPEDEIPGQYVKRKVTHFQSFAVPNPYMYNGQNPVGNDPFLNYYRVPQDSHPEPTPTRNKNNTPSEDQAIDNIKEVISKYPYYNNYQVPGYYQQPLPYYPFLQPPPLNNLQSQNNALPYPNKARQNWNWPGAGFFPIYIRDPFLQMYYAVTNMIEYGPSAGNDGPCKLTPRPQGSRVKTSPNNLALESKHLGHQITLGINKKDDTQEFNVMKLEGSKMSDLDVEDIDLDDDNFVKFTVNLPDTEETSDGRNLKNNKMSWGEFLNIHNDTQLTLLSQNRPNVYTEETVESKQAPQIIKQSIRVEDRPLEPEEEEKSENIRVGNEGSRKVFSKDNTGNGIFIQKLKVRKGGVAIAGPGGIATAGSGGTAIVGPNGVAYTHPDGLAIAGSGTKVVAVDPSIDLNEVIKNTVLNGTRHVPNTRVGKVVAVGPVVYYNRGNY